MNNLIVDSSDCYKIYCYVVLEWMHTLVMKYVSMTFHVYDVRVALVS